MHKLTRRHVIATLSSSAVMLCPAILNAQTVDLDWNDIPTTAPVGEKTLVNVEAGTAEVDVTALQPGEVAVIARPTDDEAYTATGMVQYIGVLRRTEAQVVFGVENDPAGSVQNPEYFVVNLLCTHRGKALGITGDPSVPFACTDRGERHSSNYNASGRGVSGAGDGDTLSIPEYQISVGETVILTLA